jgi:hypothetical protein
LTNRIWRSANFLRGARGSWGCFHRGDAMVGKTILRG